MYECEASPQQRLPVTRWMRAPVTAGERRRSRDRVHWGAATIPPTLQTTRTDLIDRADRFFTTASSQQPVGIKHLDSQHPYLARSPRAKRKSGTPQFLTAIGRKCQEGHAAWPTQHDECGAPTVRNLVTPLAGNESRTFGATLCPSRPRAEAQREASCLPRWGEAAGGYCDVGVLGAVLQLDHDTYLNQEGV